MSRKVPQSAAKCLAPSEEMFDFTENDLMGIHATQPREKRMMDRRRASGLKIFKLTNSLRTMLLSVSTIAMFFALTSAKELDLGPFAPIVVSTSMTALLALVCVSFASLADDVWRDPGITLVAGICGFLAYSLLVTLALVC